MNEVLFVDIETTGTDPDTHNVIEIAAEFHRDNEVVEKFHATLCDKDGSMVCNLGALKVNNTTISKLEDYTAEKQAVHNFVDWLLKLKSHNKLQICGHNVHFDVAFLKSLLSKYNVEGWDQIVSHRHKDTFTIGEFLVNAGVLEVENLYRGNSLEKLANALGINTEDLNLHSAEVDVKLTSDVYYKMLTNITQLRLNYEATKESKTSR